MFNPIRNLMSSLDTLLASEPWARQDVRRTLPFIDVVSADLLRDTALTVENDLRHGRDPVGTLFIVLDRFQEAGQDDVVDGLAELCVDAMLTRMTGGAIPARLRQMGDEIAPPA